MDRTGKNKKQQGVKPGSFASASLLCAFFIGVAMALVWGVLSSVLELENLFPDTAAARMFSQPLPVQIALYGVASPVLEEFLFRKVLYDLAVRILPRRFAAVAVSALFAVWHGNVIQMLYAFPAGLILQTLRTQSGRLPEPVSCHIGANLTAILVTALLSRT